eukprot:COSAG06_NODE_1931_length_8044_cov_5.197609_1_plen_78_part_00
MSVCEARMTLNHAVTIAGAITRSIAIVSRLGRRYTRSLVIVAPSDPILRKMERPNVSDMRPTGCVWRVPCARRPAVH